MKNKSIMVRVIIMLSLLILGALISFAEIGIATVFDLEFGGMSYVEYLQNFYSVPWHLYVALSILLASLVIGVEIIYSCISKMGK